MVITNLGVDKVKHNRSFHMKYVITIILFLCLITSSHAVSVNTYIPPKALPLLPIVKQEVNALDAGFHPSYMASAIEKESCISLTHSKCWSPTARLLTHWDKSKRVRREHGQGLGQFTRTWYRNGRIRFDTLTELTTKYRTRLNGLNWDTIEKRPDLQVRAMVLLLLETWNTLPTSMDTNNRFSMTVSAYNAGKGRLANDRRTCKLKRNCNPNVWVNNVAKIRAPGFSTNILYGKRTAWDINRGHVHEVMNVRRNKYVNWFNRN